jgi:PHD/YefM family antitoxin component YafN of YafNO toxin-antitoxin module
VFERRNLLIICSHHGEIISVTDLVRNAASIAREVEADGTVYRITRGGRGSMVLVDEAYFKAGWRLSTR